ncbi:MAG: phosphomannomutase [Methylohalobius sp. ZOD2]
MRTEPTLEQVLNSPPRPLRFGTSGVRAKVEALTDVEVYCLTRGTLAYFERIGKLAQDRKPSEPIVIPLAGDLRPSSERLLQATSAAIRDAGYDVDYCGSIPTPALTYYALAQGVAGFVVTGSHIPADRNGQKANRCDGEVLKSDEAGIIEAVEAFRAEEYGRAAEASKFGPDGMFKPQCRPDLPPADSAAVKVYRDRYRQVFSADALEGVRVLFFEYSAVGRDLLPDILTDAGAEVIRVGRSDEFIPLDTEAISESHLNLLREWVDEQDAPIHAVVSTDGDSDRPLVIGVEEGELQFFPGDLLGAAVADFLEADAAAVPVSANPGLEDFLEKRDIPLNRTRIGSPYVIEAIQHWLAAGKRKVVAWEANGGFLVGSAIPLESGTLQALPTRDAVLPILAVLAAARRRGESLGELLRAFPPRYGKSDLLDDFPREKSHRMIAYFTPDDDRGVKEVRFQQGEIVLLNGDGQEIGRWSADDPELLAWEEKRQSLEEVFSSRHGFAPLVAINGVDGLRCYFSDGEIAHVRPSGNAPQLRIYAFAATPERAREIAALAVASDGLLEQLAAQVTAAEA